MTDESDLGPQYDTAMEDAGISEEAFQASPEWARARFNKLAEQKHAERKRADEAERQNASYQARLAALEANMASPRDNGPAQPKTGLDQFDSPTKLKQVAKKILEYQQIAVDPDLEPEQRQAAKSELAKIENPQETLVDIYSRIARMESESMLGADRAEREQQARLAGKNSDLARRLVVKYGQDAIDRDSDLTKKATELIQGWMSDGSVSEDSDTTFVTLQAFKEAAEKLNKNRGGRGSDPRHSAVEGNGTANKAADASLIAALRKRGAEGDKQAMKKASKLEFGSFIQNLVKNGHIGGG